MKGKTKTQKGITLIALIITIVVLLILAAVAISSITNDNILGYAQNAAKDYNQAVKNEQDMLQEYVNYLNNHSGSTSYEAYTVGQEVKVVVEGVEHAFYVIEDSGATEEKVLLLAKENIDTTNLVQSASANSINFSTENYWGAGTSPYDIVEPETIPESHTVAKAAYDYGVKVGGTGRLMTYSEANTLRNTHSAMIYGTETTNGYLIYWLGSANSSDMVYGVQGNSDSYPILFCPVYDLNGGCRPVVVISKSKIS